MSDTDTHIMRVKGKVVGCMDRGRTIVTFTRHLGEITQSNM